jgi:small subunit ribosomal protein S20
MANIRSAKKRIRQTARRTVVNRQRLTRVRTYIKKVEAAISAGDKEAAEAALRAAEPEIARSAQKGLFHKNRAARKISRLSASIKKIGA